MPNISIISYTDRCPDCQRGLDLTTPIELIPGYHGYTTICPACHQMVRYAVIEYIPSEVTK